MNTLLAAMFSVVLAAPPDAPPFLTETKKAEDRIGVDCAADSVTFDIRSPSGIGSATIRPKSARWPATVVVRLRLAGLEGFAVSNGANTLSGCVPTHDPRTQRLHLSRAGQEQDVDSKSAYWTEIKAVGSGGKPSPEYPLKEGGYFEFAVPRALLIEPAKPVVLSWIDFYRR